MNVVDSCGWLEYFANASNAEFFTPAIRDEANLLVPSVCLYEVFKRICQQQGKQAALEGVSRLYRGTIIAMNDGLALQAAQLSLTHNLPMADSIILATARAQNAILWTQDEHFKNIEGVKYIEKK
ncbi:MAG: VapC toxin family PIN domain ribonuclease [Anaerolineae bacterium CG03_land_8_20_14_0_80_58_20]|nr:MAG: VapC toxin family PIN domain ribonuclease [Anaerolineae bacterium CG1_02_58_13]PIV27725.1 MAG: VapC toxin family PIN domain ribonuclease [Anaerolineae bacterium CG03_land_8_20_14_0_80_58_20]